MKQESENEIESRSKEVQEILTRPPHALVRWGITVFFSVLAVVFIGGCFSRSVTARLLSPLRYVWEKYL